MKVDSTTVVRSFPKAMDVSQCSGNFQKSSSRLYDCLPDVVHASHCVINMCFSMHI